MHVNCISSASPICIILRHHHLMFACPLELIVQYFPCKFSFIRLAKLGPILNYILLRQMSYYYSADSILVFSSYSIPNQFLIICSIFIFVAVSFVPPLYTKMVLKPGTLVEIQRPFSRPERFSTLAS